jgi:hypothetical protein
MSDIIIEERDRVPCHCCKAADMICGIDESAHSQKDRYHMRCENPHCPTRLDHDGWHKVPEAGSWSDSARAIARACPALRHILFHQEMGL